MTAKSTFRTTPSGPAEKLCGGCQTFKPYTSEFFHRNACKPSGLNSHCKTCQRAKCNALTIERQAMKSRDSAAQFLTQLWRTGKPPKIA